MDHGVIEERFNRALDGLVAQVREDRSVLAAILCGSLSHDTVWARSDIDLVFVTIDDQKVEQASLGLYADGMNVHTVLMPRREFRKTVEGTRRNSFVHAFLAKGRLLFAHDATIADLFERLKEDGARDRAMQLFEAAASALPLVDKAHKWFVTRGDLDYAALWMLYAATPLARIEVIGAGLIAGREVLPQALALNPTFFKMIYVDLLNTEKTREGVQAALDEVDGYLADRAPALFAPLIDHLREVGEARSCTEIETHFRKHFDLAGATTACEYLADHGLIGKASTPVRLTRRSNVDVQELAFFHLDGEDAHA